VIIKINKWSVIDIVLVFSLFIQSILFIVGFISINSTINLYIFFLNYIILILIISSLVINNQTKHFLLIIFYLCFFVFLMGQKVFMKEKNVFLTFIRTELNDKQFYVFLMILAIGIVFPYLSYMFMLNKEKRISVNNKNGGMQDSKAILPLIRLIYYGTMPFAIYMQLKIVFVRSAISYNSGFLVNVDVPAVVKMAYYIFTAITLVYLAAKPSSIELLLVIGMLIFIEGGVQLIQGRRALFATTIFFVIWYLLKFNRVKVMKLKYLICFVSVCIGLVILFFFVETSRGGMNVAKSDLAYIIESFMISTGGSDSVIGNTIVRKSYFPKPGFVYLIDPIINNPIFVIISGKSGINQGVAYIQHFNSFSHWISYLTNISLYNTGHGMGSCYLAEAYLAFNIPGAIIASIIVGGTIYKISNIELGKSLLQTSIAFMFVESIFTLPRSGLFSWFSDFIYLMICFLILFPFYYKYYNKNKEVY